MRHPRRLLKPPISDIWSKGGRARIRRPAGETWITRRRRWSGSKCDGLIKDDHNWGGRRSRDGWNKSQSVRPWGMLAQSVSPALLALSPSHSCPAIAEWARLRSGFGSSVFFGKMRSMDDAPSSPLSLSALAGWATHKTVARGRSNERRVERRRRRRP